MKKTKCWFLSTALISTNVFAQTVILSDDFESGILNHDHWTARPGINDQVGGVVEVTANIQGVDADHQGLYGVAMGRSNGGEYTTNALDLRLDLSAYEQVELSFWIKDQADDTQEHDGIWFSDDGGASFHKVYSLDVSDWSDVWGQLPPIDVDRLASENGLRLTNQFVIRFQQYGSGNFSEGYTDGIFLDDVLVTSPTVAYATLPFEDDFESGEFGDAWAWSDPYFTTLPETIRPGGLVTVVPVIQRIEASHQGRYGVAMGRRVGGGHTTNALDLHLDLSSYEQVDLSFWFKDQADDTQEQDGIWFSDDGGASFHKVYSFEVSNWSDVWGQLPPIDVAQLATENGLKLTNQFVIRFQQYGSGNFSEGYTDGIFLDDISVTSPTVTYATLPFDDGFENGELSHAWTWSDPNLTTVPETVTPGGLVSVVTNIKTVEAPYQGLYGVAIGRRTGGKTTTNALDLHLDLSAHEQAELSFWIKNNGDETQDEDGIWFSDNGGLLFRKMYTYDPSKLSSEYQKITLDVDALASEKGLKFTHQFIIRFQQYGSGNFTEGYKDGIFLDNVSVAARGTPSCSGNATYDAATGILKVPDVHFENQCFAVELEQIEPMGDFVFKLQDAVQAIR
ncbi:MAG: hypothetical protein DRR19_26175 [Candidatus Parabeggiatoa sp. nov. 1]|nr:MAG: hypothetical protein DRR19_26175 [Gammaproteobacteria bacterium]